MIKLVIIGSGGAAGAICRYLTALAVQRWSDSTFPFGTLSVNLIGCFLIGFLGCLFSSAVPIREEYRFAILVGFLGGFTTFSSFGLETFHLLNEGQRWAALGNIVVSNTLGLLLVWLGFRLAERIYGG